MNSKAIATELQRVFLRFRAGLISSQHAKEEMALLQASLRAVEQAELEAKLERLEAILTSRKN